MPDSPSPLLEFAPAGQPQAIILAVHGFNDYKAGFREIGRFAAANGILLRAYDQPGFGESPERGYWPGTRRLVEMLDQQILDLRAHHPGVPIFVLGESMGGAVVAVAASRPDFPKVDGLILTAPAVWGGDRLSPGYRMLLDIMAAGAPGLKLTGGSLKILASDDIPMLIGLGRDPLFIKGTRIDAIKGLVTLMDEAHDVAPHLDHGRMLILTGYHDEVIPPATQLDFASRVESPACTFIGYPRGWHLLLRDRQRVTVWQDILAWTRGQPPPSHLDHPCATPEG